MSCPSESAEQRRIFGWAKMSALRVPELAALYAVPNGGYRRPTEAAIMKSEGVKSGVPDIHLPVARGGFHSLYIELKRQKFATLTKYGTVSQDQLDWLSLLTLQQSYAVICRGADHAIQTIEAYLAGDYQELQSLDQWFSDIDSAEIGRFIKRKSTGKKRTQRRRATV